jgi:hypothetical protein
MTTSSLASYETTSGRSLTREEGNTFIPSKVKPLSSPLEGGHTLSCRLEEREIERESNLTIKCTGDNDDKWINR